MDVKKFRTENPDTYTSTSTGSYCEWKKKVNLEPPPTKNGINRTTASGVNGNFTDTCLSEFERKYIQIYYESLQYTLYETNMPETEDRTSEPRTKLPDSGITIVFLSTPEECLCALLEGGKRCPGDMLLVISPSWLETRPSDKNATLKTLYVHKAISMESGGRSYIDVFSPPRRVTYFVNFFTRAVTSGHREDGEELEKNLDSPMSSSLSLVKWTDDKLWTRTLMAKTKVHFPETLAFWFKIPRHYEVPPDASIEIVELEEMVDIQELVAEKVHQYINRLPRDYKKVVVKPSGIMWHGSQGVVYHDVTEVEEIIQNVVELIRHLEPEDGVLVEVFHAPQSSDPDLDRLSFRVRTTVCRGPQDNSIATTIICGIASKSAPINGDGSIPQSLETTLLQWGLTTPDIKEIKREILEGSERVLDEIIKQEKTMTDEERGGIGAQTDIIGIDYVLGYKNGRVVPVGIEVNSHDCTFNCQLYEFQNPELLGQSVRPLVATMCTRSQRYMMWEKTVVVIGADEWILEFLDSVIEELKIKVILVTDKPKNFQKNNRYNMEVLQYNNHDHQPDLQYLTDLLKDCTVDGCCSFVNDNLVLTSSLCDALSVRPMGTNATHIVRSIKQIHDKLAKTVYIPHFSRTYHYTLRCVEIKSLEDLLAGTEDLGFPCVLISDRRSSVLSKVLKDKEACISAYNELQGPKMDSSSCQIFLMPYAKGSEHYVAVVIFRRKLLRAFVCDKEKSSEAQGPELTTLQSDQIGQIRTAGYQCCTELGFTDGVFVVKIILSNIGPKLIKVYPSINSGIYKSIKSSYSIDLLKCSLMIACGIKPILLD